VSLRLTSVYADLGAAVAEVRRAIEIQAAKSILQALDWDGLEGAINAPSINSP
jgi:hypothetical protein